MRTLLALASLTFLTFGTIGCGDDTTSGGGMDLAVGADMTATPLDMMTLNCSQIVMCAANAASTAAAQSCISEGKTASQTKFTTMLGCALTACGPADGGGTGMCTGLTDMSTGCRNCEQGVITAGITGGGACAAQVGACFGDT
jgi:hypothetical protein